MIMSSNRAFPNFTLKNFRDRLDLASLIFAPYVLTVVWQFLAVIPNKTVGWIIAVIVSAVLWYVIVALKETPQEKISGQFWLVVALPLLLVYLLRVSFPDVSFDVLNYHIFHSE